MKNNDPTMYNYDGLLNELGDDKNEPVEPSPEKKEQLEATFKSMIAAFPKSFEGVWSGGAKPKMWFTGSQEEWDQLPPELKSRFENDNPTN